MTPISALTTLHVVCLTLAYGLLLASDVWMLSLARAGNAIAFRTAAGVGASIGRTTGVLFLVGILAGLYLAHMLGYSFGTPWLLSTYALLVFGTVLIVALSIPWRVRAMRELEGKDGAAADEALRDLALRQRLPLGALSTFIVMAAIVWLMTAKP